MLKDALLWEIKSAEASPSYLFGTMHVADDRAFDLTGSVFRYIDQCEIFAAELDMRQQPAAFPGLYTADSERLSSRYSPRVYARMEQIVRKAFQIELSHCDHLPAVFVVQLITQAVLNDDHAQSLDQTLWSYAERSGKQLCGLETIDEQMGLLHRMQAEDGWKDLARICRNVTRFRASVLSIIEKYHRQDLRGMYKSSRRSLGGNRKWMLNHRNPLMTERLASLMKEGPVFAAVGCGHLPGKWGMLRLLKKAGYTVAVASH